MRCSFQKLVSKNPLTQEALSGTKKTPVNILKYILNEDGSDITQDVDVLVWWRDVEQARFPHITVVTRQFPPIPETSVITERVFSFAGLTLSDLCKSLVEGTLETIMWTNCEVSIRVHNC